MNKSLKVVLLLSLTLVISALAIASVYTYLNSADSEANKTHGPDNEKESEPLKVEVDREYEDPYQKVYEKELRDQLAAKSLAEGFPKSPYDPADLKPNGQLPFDYEPLESFQEKDKRLLPDGNTLTEPGIIAFDKQSQTKYKYYAYRHIFNNLKEYSTRFVVYPYHFTFYPDPTNPDQTVAYDEGAVFTLKPELLPDDWQAWNYFDSVKAKTNVEFGKAKAFYDVNMGILSIADYYNNVYTDLFFEASTYCDRLTSYLAKYKDCLANAKAYYAFKNDTKNAGKTSLLMMGPEEIVTYNLLFTADGAPRIKLLLITDYFGDAETLIANRLGSAGIAKIKAFVEAGGIVWASGKAGRLLEGWGILPTGFYKKSEVLASTHPDQLQRLKGCTSQDMDFFPSLMCMNVGTNGIGYSYLSSAYVVDQTKAAGFTVLMSYDETSTTLKKRDNIGFLLDLTAADKAFIPFSMMGSYGKGQIMLINGNPLYKSSYDEIFYNALMVSMSKNIVFDAYIGTKDNKPIPGGEAGIQLDVSISFINLYDLPISDMKIHVWLPNKVVPSDMPDSCVADPNPPTFFVNTTYVNASSHIVCSQSSVPAFTKFSAVINVEILDATVTQQKYDILMALPAVEYTESDSGITYQYEVEAIRTSAALAALLRGALNPDPSSFYPIKGRGQYVDNVLQVENKEDTKAIDVEYIGMVPLISPVVDGSDQTAVIQAARFLPSYYKNETRTYYYPFTHTLNQNFDVVDFAWLNEKNIVLCAEWDIPVKPLKMTRPDTFPEVPETGDFDIINMGYSMNIDSKRLVMQQTFYDNADKFFEHASQRLMAFVDISKEKGAKTRYPDGIPAHEVNPTNPNVAKKELVWTRSDVYFYAATDYQKPANITYQHVISVDNYPMPTGYTCAKQLGGAHSIIQVPGFFDVNQPEGLKPNEWSNELLMHCDKIKVGLNDVESVSGGSIKPIHYLVPNTDPEVTQADHIMNFTNNGDGTGNMDDYPDLKFIYAHSVNQLVDGSISRQGGKLEIYLDSAVGFINEDTVDPISKGYVTYSADQVGFYKTTYDKENHMITAYFKRGLMPNEAYGKPSLLGVMIEQLNINTDTPVTCKLYEMKYDISLPAQNFERYTLRETRSLTLKRGSFFSMPALEVHVKMNRTGSSEMLGYELLEAFSRFGVYIQELQRHRTVYASTETHNVNDPGVVAINGGFAMISNLGISSVPFAEYVTTGRALLIPSSPTTSRIEWLDIWGRKWSQPLRSLFPDIPPIPPPLKNFIMTTTYELFKKGTTQRVLTWTSDEELDIRVQLKLLNNYPKYFEITKCHDNNVTYFQTRETMFEKARIFDLEPYSFALTQDQVPTDRYHINYGHKSTYGMCFNEDGTVLEGKNITADQRHLIETAYLCSQNPDPAYILQCASQFVNLPTVRRRPKTFTDPLWMYNPKVERYYPRNYIKPIMWDLTHYDYDDNPMDKAYKYHMDNNLPGIDYGPPQNPAKLKPHNLIAQPIWKGFGYKITYEKTKRLAKFPTHNGWWSDNLQNKDHTLVAGQETVNDISVDKPTLLPDSMWINAKQLTDSGTQSVINARLKNIHTCLYNQYRVKLSHSQERLAYLGNVYQNNIIPIMPDLEKNDPRLTNFDCSNVYQYSPNNISQVDNIVATPTIRDWLYFAANLRGGALENINIPYTMSPIPGIKIEGLAKVQDGGRFVYWNPANGPNSFLIVDNPVNVVEAVRCDLDIEAEVIPKAASTFMPVIYHLLKVSDPAEVLREWKYETYTNNYGYGDATTAIFVGGIEHTFATIAPGQSTYVKVTLYNNAGFDWNMLGEAIKFDLLGYQAISANDLLMNIVHAILRPQKYNFMVLDIPDELKDYITIEPSDHNIDVAPQFFDFSNINVVTIRDGYKGDYYYKITLASYVPDNLLGKVQEIKIKLDGTYFDKLPGADNDPIKAFHDYTLEVPSIKFGIPYPDGHKYAGKVFYTSGYSTDMEIRAGVPNYWQIPEARLLSEEKVDQLRLATAEGQDTNTKLQAVWDSLTDDLPIPVTNVTAGADSTLILNMTDAFPTFPKKNGNDPDIASFYLLLRAFTNNIPYGTAVRVMSSPRVRYMDLVRKQKSEVIAEPVDKTVSTSGPSIGVSYSYKLVNKNSAGFYEDAPDQRIFNTDQSGTVRVVLIMSNVGNGRAYDANFTLSLGDGVTLIEDQMPAYLQYNIDTRNAEKFLKLITKLSLNGFSNHAEKIYLQFNRTSSRRLLQNGNVAWYLIKSVSAEIQTTDEAAAPVMSQSISTPLALSVKTRERDTVALTVSTSYDEKSLPVFFLSATANPSKVNDKDVRYKMRRRIVNLDCEDLQNAPAGLKCADILNTNWVQILANGFENSVYDRPIANTFTGNLKSGVFEIEVTTYDDTANRLAITTLQVIAEKPNPSPTPNPNVNPTPTPTPTPNNNDNNKNNSSPNDIGDPARPDDTGYDNNTNRTNNTVVDQSKAGDEYKLPIYAIVLIPSAAVAIMVVAAILIYRKWRIPKIVPDNSDEIVVKVDPNSIDG